MTRFVSVRAFAAAFALFIAPSLAAAAEVTAVFAGGCFWCVESDFEKLDGVEKAVSGYTGGDLQNPTYEDHEGHVEAVEVTYDPDVVSYRSLVDYLLRHIDPLDDGGQFCDRGPSYKSAIFVADDEERAAAQAAIVEAESELGEKVVTPIRDRGAFWIAEDYHQNYYKKNPIQYRFYRSRCGRDARVKKVWGAH
ncbi:MAG TPA: peptide-methionine (S)-S-oxide reductase MsrA [Parvularculaceae bacterium]|nr:peptide-methionine (S)-S-oxide reductase MsrA [Amphiplicatus sp.]MCB9955433.1 peptide-methionine (S)-S-oxide reductase MsrA [Caulobacterales bacterium]HPE32824.1 peptide-methionine (S)-S-oxide reductase MsrA [Parvularculaceae bacterium]